MIGCPVTRAHHRVLHMLHTHGPLTVQELTDLLWPDVVSDPLLALSLLAHLIDHGWVGHQSLDDSFTLTAQGREALLSSSRLP